MGNYALSVQGYAQLRLLEKAARDLIGDEILHDSQLLVPVKSGRLKASGFVDSDAATTRIGYDTPYAADVELGTAHMPAEPYLRPAALRPR